MSSQTPLSFPPSHPLYAFHHSSSSSFFFLLSMHPTVIFYFLLKFSSLYHAFAYEFTLLISISHSPPPSSPLLLLLLHSSFSSPPPLLLLSFSSSFSSSPPPPPLTFILRARNRMNRSIRFTAVKQFLNSLELQVVADTSIDLEVKQADVIMLKRFRCWSDLMSSCSSDSNR